jgi:hypothetical protein
MRPLETHALARTRIKDQALELTLHLALPIVGCTFRNGLYGPDGG